MSRKARLLSYQEIDKCISRDEILDTVEAVFKAQAENCLIIPPKLHLDMSETGKDSWFNALPCYIGFQDIAGLKWVGGFGNNKNKGLPYIMGLIILADPDTGEFVAVMDGANITNLRTGATAAIAVKNTACQGAKNVALIGAGMQNRMTMRFLRLIYDDLEIRVSDIEPAACQEFKLEMESELGWEVNVMVDNSQAAQGADVIVTATQADAALIMDDWIKPGATAISLGSYQEFDEQFVLKADKIIVDDWAQCSHRGELKKLSESGTIDEKDIYAHISEVVAGRKPGRTSQTERILTHLVGLGVHDIAVSYKAWKQAEKLGIGKEFSFV